MFETLIVFVCGFLAGRFWFKLTDWFNGWLDKA